MSSRVIVLEDAWRQGIKHRRLKTMFEWSEEYQNRPMSFRVCCRVESSASRRKKIEINGSKCWRDVHDDAPIKALGNCDCSIVERP